MSTTRCDLHVHSAASVGNDEWYTRVFGCPESYAAPERQYELCKSRGMSLVTLTDHDTIAGALTLVDRPDFFISEEITATFPENGCVMHVLAWNITQGQHEDIQSVRANIYQLCDYLNRERIAHALAHPLLSPNWRLDADTFEKVLLLFPALEAINGLVDRRIEPDLFTILDRLSPDVVAALSRKHGVQPQGTATWSKAFVAGSDDHVHRRCGTVYTEVEGTLSTSAFLDRCMAGAARPVGQQGHLHTMAACIKHTAYHHFSGRADGPSARSNPFLDVMDVLAGRDPRGAATSGDRPVEGFVESLLASLRSADMAPGCRLDILHTSSSPTEEDDARIVEAVAELSNKILERSLGDLVDALNDFDLYGIFSGCRDLAGALVAAAPPFFAAHHFGRQERQVARLWDQWSAFALPPRSERMALFSDSVEHLDGVSTWCARFLARARAAGQEVFMPHCGTGLPDGGWAAAGDRLPVVTSFRAPLYDQLRFYVPSPVHTMVWAWSRGITHFELATPGPMGLIGLLVAKVLQLPVTASYHTELPALLRQLGGPDALHRGVRHYLRWFYRQANRVFCFSDSSRSSLVDLGIDAKAIQLVPQAVDPTEFSPSHSSPAVFAELSVGVCERPIVLSVGRLSKEKNLPLIIAAVGELQHRPNPPMLVIAGDGPERECLEALCSSKPFVRFVGVQRGEILRKLYASATMFVFASEIDTLGLVNMEAMASGIPILVPAGSGIAELVTQGVSAECYPLNASALAAAIERLLQDARYARRLGKAGRRAMIARWDAASFSDLWNSMVRDPLP